MKHIIFILFLFSNMSYSQDVIKISQDILYAARTGDSTEELQQQVASIPIPSLMDQLNTDDRRNAFWINIYNAYTQISLQKDPGSYKKRNKFFRNKFIQIAGKNISLDLVEHGIIRRSKWKYSLGHFNKLFKSKFERQFRVERLDYRIHFALNCGAKSCPPIAFYKPEQINQQLELATRSYLKSEIEYNKEVNVVEVPAILSWFRGDFGGKKGIIKILKEKNLIPQDALPKIKWKNYDWSLALKQYSEN